MRREDAEAFYLNTSHVLIYQMLTDLQALNQRNLNTSHVLIYHFTENGVVLLLDI